MAFFDAQPAGRLLNRFSKDTEAADILLRENLAYWISETCAPRPDTHLDFASHRSFSLDHFPFSTSSSATPYTKSSSD